MNERLAKLTEQCYEYNETLQDTWFNKAKFARLIVRECALQCNHNDDMDRILEYFGVEE